MYRVSYVIVFLLCIILLVSKRVLYTHYIGLSILPSWYWMAIGLCRIAIGPAQEVHRVLHCFLVRPGPWFSSTPSELAVKCAKRLWAIGNRQYIMPPPAPWCFEISMFWNCFHSISYPDRRLWCENCFFNTNLTRRIDLHKPEGSGISKFFPGPTLFPDLTWFSTPTLFSGANSSLGPTLFQH